MKVTDYRWIGLLAHDYEATCDFFERDLGLKLEQADDQREITLLALPFELFVP
jgi:predicted enzyme related to lactoylglutathione lyase